MKLSWQDDLRRVHLEEPTFAALVALVAATFTLPVSSSSDGVAGVLGAGLRLVYTDPEGDTLTLTNDGEVGEALAVTASSPTPRALVVRVVPAMPAPSLAPLSAPADVSGAAAPSTSVLPLAGMPAPPVVWGVDSPAVVGHHEPASPLPQWLLEEEERDLQAALRASTAGGPGTRVGAGGAVAGVPAPRDPPHSSLSAYASQDYHHPNPRFIWRPYD